MKYEWDKNKNKENIQKHGISLADGHHLFSGPLLARLDTRKDYGEDRWVGIGLIKGTVVVAVWIEDEDEELVRLISSEKGVKT